MTTEISMLIAATGVLGATIIAQATHLMFAFPPMATMGTRDELKLTTLAERLQRLVHNHLEGTALFIPLVVAISLTGATVEANGIHWGSAPLSALGAQVFAASRVVHAVTYGLGIPVIRSLAWMVGMTGLVMMVIALF